MPTQFSNALKALKEGTEAFNLKYGIESVKKPMIKRPSQFELAKLALRSNSPVEFNEMYSYSPKGGKRKTRRGKRSSRKTRRFNKK